MLNLIHFSAKLAILICENGSTGSAFINTSPLLLFCPDSIWREKKSTPSDAYNASCNTLTVGDFASRVEGKGRELLALSWESSAVGSGSEGVD